MGAVVDMSLLEERDRKLEAFIGWVSERLSIEKDQLIHMYDLMMRCGCNVTFTYCEVDEKSTCHSWAMEEEQRFMDAHEGMKPMQWQAHVHKRLTEIEHEKRMLVDEQYRKAQLEGKLP
jgi:hypothetical protein